MKFLQRLFGKNILILILLFFLPYELFASQKITFRGGDFAFGWATRFQETRAFELPYIDGFTAYTAWNLIEKEEGKFDWSALDTLIEKAKKNNKVVNIGVYPSAVPKWLFEKYDVKTFKWIKEFKEHRAIELGKEYEERISPLPWDKVYLRKWKDFVKVLAQRYGDHENVGYIALTGPTMRDLDMSLPIKSKELIKKFKMAGYDKDKIINAWIEIMDFYAEVLPKKKWSLAIGSLIIGEKDPWPAFKIVDYGLKKYQQNLIIMAVWLNDTWFGRGESKKIIELIKRSQKYTITGFQMSQSAYLNSKWKEKKPIVRSLRKSFNNGFDLGMSFIEVWHADIILPGSNKANSEYVDDLQYMHDKLRRKISTEFIKYNGEFEEVYLKKKIP